MGVRLRPGPSPETVPDLSAIAPRCLQGQCGGVEISVQQSARHVAHVSAEGRPSRRDAAANPVCRREYPLAAPTDERLHIEHFVLFAGGVAIAAWGERTIYEAISQPSVSLLLGSFGLQVLLQVLLQGAGIASLGLLMLRRYQRRRDRFRVNLTKAAGL